MGGMLARAEQWQAFQKNFDKAKKHFGFRIFHTRKFKNRDGDFKGWNVDRQWELMRELARLTGAGLTEGVSIILDNETFEANYKGEKTEEGEAR